ncbi:MULTISPECIES: NADH-ubiquinone oxidoreductase subunit E family protein [unclassified Campylobacter]|uniref:NADH-ubiquinone oxidoreductase subunit E family protein n=1 Tax=Campylobacter TaxID=194 RepID=UPI001474BF0E|nr:MULTISPECIES: NADH-ubiquinone oxidoreductase subunit E family protein [unclassified Campylobacter]
MKRVDLRHLKAKFEREFERCVLKLRSGEVCIYLFEIGDFECIERCANLAVRNGCEIMNSLKFNQVDWMMAIKKN